MGWCFFLYRYWYTAFLTYLHVSQFVFVLPVYVLCVIPPVARSVARLSFNSLSSSFPVILAIQYFILSRYLYVIVGWISVSLSIKLPCANLKKTDKIAVVNQPRRWTTCVKS